MLLSDQDIERIVLRVIRESLALKKEDRLKYISDELDKEYNKPGHGELGYRAPSAFSRLVTNGYVTLCRDVNTAWDGNAATNLDVPRQIISAITAVTEKGHEFLGS